MLTTIYSPLLQAGALLSPNKCTMTPGYGNRDLRLALALSVMASKQAKFGKLLGVIPHHSAFSVGFI